MNVNNLVCFIIYYEAPRRKQRGILKQNQLFTLMQNYVLLLNPQVSNVLRYTGLVSKFTHRIHKVSIRPKLSTPKLFLHLRMFLENLPGSYTFYYSVNFTCTQSWNGLDQKVNMIFVCSNFKKVNIITLLDFQTYIFYCQINCLTYYHSSILGRTNKMIQQYRYIMRFMYVFAFTHTYKDITLRSKLRGTNPKRD